NERSARAKFWAAMQTEGSEFRFGAQAPSELAHTSPGFKLGCGTPHTRSRLKSANMLLAPSVKQRKDASLPVVPGVRRRLRRNLSARACEVAVPGCVVMMHCCSPANCILGDTLNLGV